MDCPGSAVHRISQARILEWVAISSSRGSSWPRDGSHVSCTASGFCTTSATREKPPFPCCWSFAKSSPTLCNLMDCNMPGSSVLHYLLEFAQIHVHWVWFCLTILSSAAPFSSCPQSFPAPGSFPKSSLFTSDGQIIGASASALPVNIQGWIPLGLTDLISLLSKKLSRVFFSATIWKHQFFGSQPLFGPTLISIHDYWKTIVLTNTDRFQQSDSAF